MGRCDETLSSELLSSLQYEVLEQLYNEYSVAVPDAQARSQCLGMARPLDA
jgi:hypothetical protein